MNSVITSELSSVGMKKGIYYGNTKSSFTSKSHGSADPLATQWNRKINPAVKVMEKMELR